MKKTDLIVLKEKINSRITLDDAVLATLYALDENYVVTNTALLQSLYYEISQKYDIEELNSLVFNTSSTHPFSSELYEAFFRLECNGMLPYYLATDSVYDLSCRTEVLKKSFEKYDEHRQDEINNAATIVLKKASVRL